MGGKRLLPKPGSRSAVRPPTGYCARCALVEKLLSRMAGMVTLLNCEQTSGSGWRTTYCLTSPGTPSRVVQTAFQDRFGIQISIGYLNQVRARLGLERRTQE